MLALCEKAMRQCDLWKVLGVVRSAVSELLEVLTSLGWVKRIRAADGRTKLVSLTVRGRAIFDSAYARCIRSGDATIEVNFALKGLRGSADPNAERTGAVTAAQRIVGHFGWTLADASDLYLWDPEEIFDQMDWPIGENAHYELRIADPGMIDAPMFEAGDLLAEIED